MSASTTITRDPDWPGPAVPPGKMLIEEFLEPLGLRQAEAAERLGISASRLRTVVFGKRRITADTALRLSRMLNTSPQFWMRLQADWDLHCAVQRKRVATERAGRQPFPSDSRDLLRAADRQGAVRAVVARDREEA